MDDSIPKRTFSYEEAAALLPEVRRITEEAYQLASSVATPGMLESLTPEVEGRLGEILSEWAQAVMATGAEVKGLWLVDFDNGSGYYCWHYPEKGLHYYHSYEEGFRGRMRIH